MKNILFLIAALFCFNGAFANEEETAPVQEIAQDSAPDSESTASMEETAEATQSSCGCIKR